MRVRIFLGILLPVVIIVAFIILSSSNTNISVEKETIESIQFDELFKWEGVWNQRVAIQTIHLENDFFLPTRYELPLIAVCMQTKEGAVMATTAREMSAMYSEGTYGGSGYDPIFGDFNYYNYDSRSRRGVEVAAKGKKDVKIFVNVLAIQLEQEEEGYKEYEELLLIELKPQEKESGRYIGARYRYNPCGDLTKEELATAIRIPIIQ